MNVSELDSVLRHIGATGTVVAQALQNLVQLASSQPNVQRARPAGAAAQQQPPQPAVTNEQLLAARSAVESALASPEPPADWTAAMRYAFNVFAARTLGNGGRDVVLAIFAQSMASPGVLSRNLQPQLHEVTQLVQRTTNALPVVEMLAPASATTSTPTEDEGAALLHFGDGVPTKHLAEIAEWARDWDHIMKTLARATHSPTESPRVADIARGSLELVLMAGVSVLVALATIAEKVATAREKVLSAKKLSIEIERLGADPKDIESQVQAKAAAEETAAVDTLLKENNWTGPEANELAATLRVCTARLADFYILGGRIDFKLPPTSPDAQRQQELVKAREREAAFRVISSRVDALTTELTAIKQLPPGPKRPDPNQDLPTPPAPNPKPDQQP